MIPKHKYILLITVSIVLLSALFLAFQSDSPEEETLTNEDGADTQVPTTHDNAAIINNKIFIKGSDTILPVSNAESEAYMKLHPEHEIIIIGGGSSLGIASFIEGEVEIAMASRKIKESEIETAADKGIEPIETIIAWDGISVIVNKDNPLESLSIEQLKRIYTGEITNWKDLRGNDEEIKVLIRDSSSGTYGFFKENVLLDEEYFQGAITEPNTEAVVGDVSTDTAAIGYIGLAYMDESVKMLGLGVQEDVFYPEAELIRGGTYPLSRPLQYYTNGRPEGIAKEYIDFVLSDTGQEIVSNVGYLPVR
ncbi:PstS family phosphate ABC transporter substrate-binding protein [Methanolobus sp. ZRKC2]|uniref:PstS family phosphate ABC transporter substrate-binding protein n=1 Tax=Methanolobus sp. ZRKC2 TaxID=3125783 RepID=UPI0032438EDF